MMNSILAEQFSDSNPDNNQQQLNALYLNLHATGAVADREAFALGQYFSDLYTKARFSIENTFDKFLTGARVDIASTRKFNKVIEETPFSDTMDYRAEIPEGLSVTFLEYLEVLLPAQERANRVLNDVIVPFESFVGKLLMDEVFRGQASHQIKEFKHLEGDYQKVVKDFGKCFGKNSYKASAKFSNVVKRNGDWALVFKNTNELIRLYDNFPQVEITKRLNRLYENLDALVELIDNNKFGESNKDTNRNLADGVYHIAKEVELAALTTYRSKTFIEAVNVNIRSLDDVADRRDDGDHEYR